MQISRYLLILYKLSMTSSAIRLACTLLLLMTVSKSLFPCQQGGSAQQPLGPLHTPAHSLVICLAMLVLYKVSVIVELPFACVLLLLMIACN